MTANSLRLLIIEDEPAIRRFLRTSLSVHNYRLLEAADGASGLKLMASERPEFVILDLGLGDMDGLEVLRRLRAEWRTPIIVLSARSDEQIKIAALEAGADDYVTKPFHMGELVARLRNAYRHSFYVKGEEPVFRNGELHFDAIHRRVTVAGLEIKLSPTEFAILQLLVRYAGKVLTHQQILSEIWGSDRDVQYLRIYVGHLRRKLEQDPQRPQHIITEAGVGYRLQRVDSAFGITSAAISQSV